MVGDAGSHAGDVLAERAQQPCGSFRATAELQAHHGHQRLHAAARPGQQPQHLARRRLARLIDPAGRHKAESRYMEKGEMTLPNERHLPLRNLTRAWNKLQLMKLPPQEAIFCSSHPFQRTHRFK